MSNAARNDTTTGAEGGPGWKDTQRNERIARATYSLESRMCDLRNAATLMHDAEPNRDVGVEDMSPEDRKAFNAASFAVYEVADRVEELFTAYYAALNGVADTDPPNEPTDAEASLDAAFVAAGSKDADDEANTEHPDLAAMSVGELVREWEISRAAAAHDFSLSDRSDAACKSIFAPAEKRQGAIVEELATRRGKRHPTPTAADCYAVAALLQQMVREDGVVEDHHRALVSSLAWWLGDMNRSDATGVAEAA